jgi:hypothetical protein
MSNQHRLNRLVQLNAIASKALEIKFSGYEDEDESNMVRNSVVGAGAVGAGGYGAYKGRQGVINKYGVTDDFGNRVARRGMYGDAMRGEYGELRGKVKSGIDTIKGDYKEARLGEWGSGAKVGQRLGRGRAAAAGDVVAKLIARLRGK